MKFRPTFKHLVMRVDPESSTTVTRSGIHLPPSIPTEHEIRSLIGEVIAVGAGIEDIKIGDSVVARQDQAIEIKDEYGVSHHVLEYNAVLTVIEKEI